MDLFQSLPTRECGLKSIIVLVFADRKLVTPYAGVWIEISIESITAVLITVTPYAGVWIEIK